MKRPLRGNHHRQSGHWKKQLRQHDLLRVVRVEELQRPQGQQEAAGTFENCSGPWLHGAMAQHRERYGYKESDADRLHGRAAAPVGEALTGTKVTSSSQAAP